MYYIVDIYTYYCYDVRKEEVTVLAMAETKEEIYGFAREINNNREYECYFGYCHNVGVYRCDGLVPPFKFRDMRPWRNFEDII